MASYSLYKPLKNHTPKKGLVIHFHCSINDRAGQAWSLPGLEFWQAGDSLNQRMKSHEFSSIHGRAVLFGSTVSFPLYLLCTTLFQVIELGYSLSSLCRFQITKVPENLLPFAVQCRNLTVSNTRTVLLTPEIYVDQNIHEQLVDLMLEAIQGAREYISKSCECLHFDFQI